MTSTILTTATRLLAPLLLVFSVYVLLRGHNEPGGGFIGGLIATTAFALVEKAEGVARARRLLRLPPLTVAAVGLGAALGAALWGAIAKGYVLAGVWPLLEKAADGSKSGLPVGSVLLFDVGVYLVVVGAVCAMLFALEEAATAPRFETDDDQGGKTEDGDPATPATPDLSRSHISADVRASREDRPGPLPNPPRKRGGSPASAHLSVRSPASRDAPAGLLPHLWGRSGGGSGGKRRRSICVNRIATPDGGR